jgi:predicted glycosyl hydrolase (DUF1957 family)
MNRSRRHEGQMDTVIVGLLLHYYQPPGQLAGVLRRVVHECYRPLLKLFQEHPTARATFNVNGGLTEMLDDHGYADVLEGWRALAASGRVEFTSSGKYHPILPLIPAAEAARQIALNDEANRRLLGEVYRPRGFFPPEMAWDHALAPLVARAGLDWVVMSGIACPVEWPVTRVHREAAGDGHALAILFRDDLLSNKVAFRTTDVAGFLQDVHRLGSDGTDRYVVIAMDAETFGHHIPGWEREFLAPLFAALAAGPPVRAAAANPAPAPRVRLATLSEIVDQMPAAPAVVPRASSWSTTREDLEHHNPYPLWRHRGNEIHRLLWWHLEQAMALLQLAEQWRDPDGDQDFATARAAADMALHSDQFWWASRRPHWSPGMVHRGLNLQRDLILHAVRALNLSDAPDEARREAQERVAVARDLANRITDRLFWD